MQLEAYEIKRYRLLAKVIFYYTLLVALIWAVAFYFPDWLHVMPFGGLDNFQNQNDATTIVDLSEIKLYEQSRHLFFDTLNLVTAMIGVVAVMIPIRWVYISVSEPHSSKRAISSGMMLLPMVVTAIVAVVQFSLALAFALTGIFAGVRYRTTIKSLSDAFFTFAAIAVGLAAGTRSLGIALALAIFFSITIILFPPTQDPKAAGEK